MAQTATAPARPAVPPLSPRLQLVRAVLVLLLAMSMSLLLQLVLISGRQHSSAQQRKFDAFRSQLAGGTAPIGPTDQDGKAIGVGTPVAYLEIPSIGVREVVSEGTSAGVLYDGPGHRRDTVLPGQAGTSVIFGRRASFGGPFSDLPSLRKDAAITVTTGQGVFTFKVIAVHYNGDRAPAAPAKDGSRLVLATAAGTPFLPSGLLQVDADLDTAAATGNTVTGGPARLLTGETLPAEERAMNNDTRTLWALAMWLQALIVASAAAVWAWHRWGRAQAWIVFLPVLMLLGLSAAGEAARLLPNLL
jgi:sortase (surface protein transpeptidase)